MIPAHCGKWWALKNKVSLMIVSVLTLMRYLRPQYYYLRNNYCISFAILF